MKEVKSASKGWGALYSARSFKCVFILYYVYTCVPMSMCVCIYMNIYTCPPLYAYVHTQAYVWCVCMYVCA